MFAMCFAAACTTGTHSSDGGGEAGATYVAAGGVLLDDRLRQVGEVPWPEGTDDIAVRDDGQVLFSSDMEATEAWDCCGSDRWSLYVSVDGEAPRELVPGRVGVADVSPDWSPDGESAVFIRQRAPLYVDGEVTEDESVQEGVHVRHLETGETRLLAEGIYRKVDWSPDGSLIAALERDARTLQLLDAETGDLRASVAVDGDGFAWSPAGDVVAVEVAEGDRIAVGFYDVEGSALQVVPGTATQETFVHAWGPDGPVVELNRTHPDSVLAVVDPDALRVRALRRCGGTDECLRPLTVLPTALG